MVILVVLFFLYSKDVQKTLKYQSFHFQLVSISTQFSIQCSRSKEYEKLLSILIYIGLTSRKFNV